IELGQSGTLAQYRRVLFQALEAADEVVVDVIEIGDQVLWAPVLIHAFRRTGFEPAEKLAESQHVAVRILQHVMLGTVALALGDGLDDEAFTAIALVSVNMLDLVAIGRQDATPRVTHEYRAHIAGVGQVTIVHEGRLTTEVRQSVAAAIIDADAVVQPVPGGDAKRVFPAGIGNLGYQAEYKTIVDDHMPRAREFLLALTHTRLFQ